MDFTAKKPTRMSQSHHYHAEEYELVIKKMKDEVGNKVQDYQKLKLQYQRQKEINCLQKENLKQQVKLLLQKKNGELIQLKQEMQKRLRNLEEEKQRQIEEINYHHTRDMNYINKQLQARNRDLQRLTNASNQGAKDKDKFLQKLQNEKEEIQIKYQKKLNDQYQKYENLKGNFNKLIFETTQLQENNWRQLQLMFNSQYQKIFDLVKQKDSEVLSLKKRIQLVITDHNIQIETLQLQKQLFKDQVRIQSQNHQKQIELLKVKMGILHQTDLKKIKDVYETKLNHSFQNNTRLEEQNDKLREMLNMANDQKFETKKKHDIAIAQLNSKILKMKMGMHSLQSDFKEKIENERSLMLMTSRSFLKEAEVKNHSNKFHQEQIRKLRQLMDLKEKENENAERAVEQRINTANNELQRLSSQVVNVAQEKKQLEQAMQKLRIQKDKQISLLKAEINSIQMPQRSIKAELQLVEDLKQQMNKKIEEISILKDRIHSLESRMKQMKAQVQRANMQAQINHQEGKKQYHEIAQAHLKDFKKFYEDKLKRVQQEKQELKKIINSQFQKITLLTNKYKELEQGMKEAVGLMKKRTVLQEKVMNIGLDNNLIKNISQLLPGFPDF